MVLDFYTNEKGTSLVVQAYFNNASSRWFRFKDEIVGKESDRVSLILNKKEGVVFFNSIEEVKLHLIEGTYIGTDLTSDLMYVKLKDLIISAL